MKILINISKIIVAIAAFFLFIEIAEIAQGQEWSSKFAVLNNWGMMWQFIFFGLVVFNMAILIGKVNRQDETIKQLYRDMLELKSENTRRNISVFERIVTIECKLGMRKDM